MQRKQIVILLANLLCITSVVAADDDLFEPVFYCSPGVRLDWLQGRLRQEADARPNFVLGDAVAESSALVARLHRRGVFGPAWEFLIR